MHREIKIGNRLIGDQHQPVIIAEIGINHGGNLKEAIKIADKAIEAGAEIIKHQTHIVDDEMIDAAKKIKPGNSNKSIYQIIKQSALSASDEYKLMCYVKKKKRIFISTPFSRKAVDRLREFNVPAIKIGSGECNNYPLIEYAAKLRKPIILSTGMNSIKSIKPAVEILKKNKTNYALLHCTNIYPTPAKLVRLNCIYELMKNFKNAVIGLSDHTTNNYSSLGALGIGASIIEKHFTDIKKRKGPDISSSMDPSELRELINASKVIHQALSFKGKKLPLKEEVSTIRFAYSSVVSIKDIEKGEKLTKSNIWVKRPGTGDFKAKDFFKLIGKKVTQSVKTGQLIKKIYIKN